MPDIRHLPSRLADNIGANRTVLALSMARLGDAIRNSILFIVIPLYLAKLPAPWFPIPEAHRSESGAAKIRKTAPAAND